MAISEKERVFLEMTLRQIAPQIKTLLEQFSVIWDIPFYETYLVGRYADGVPLEDPKSAIIEVKNTRNKESAPFDTTSAVGLQSGTSESALMQQMFPLFHSEFVSEAQKLDVPVSDIFMVLRYIKSKEVNIADTIDLQLRCVSKKDFIKRIS